MSSESKCMTSFMGWYTQGYVLPRTWPTSPPTGGHSSPLRRWGMVKEVGVATAITTTGQWHGGEIEYSIREKNCLEISRHDM